MKALSMDLRERVLADSDAGLPTQQVAKKYRVSRSWVRRVKQRRRESGEIGPRSQRHGRVPKLAGHHDTLRNLVAQRPDATAEELRGRLPVAVSRPTVQRTLQLLKLTFKKRR